MELNNIIKVEWAYAREVAPLFIQETLTECSLSDNVNWHEVPDIKVPARMTSENEIKDKEIFDRTEVKFKTCERLACSYNNICLRLTLHNGAKILVGNGKRPYGAMAYSFIHPESVTDSQLREYTFRRLAKVGPMMIYDSGFGPNFCCM